MKLITNACALLLATAIIVTTAPAAGQGGAAKVLAENAVNKSSGHKMDRSELTWYDGMLFTIEGRGFVDTVTSYSRLAPRHKAKVPGGVWNNGQSGAGVTVRFVTDSTRISAAWGPVKPAMPHMAWSGSGGLDLYAREGDEWVFRGAGNPTSTTSVAKVLRAENTGRIPTEYLMFMPSYSSVEKLEIGIDADATISPGPNRYAGKLPIVFYGTSISQGGCASRSGMGHIGILRRMLDYPVVNLGFSGSGKGEIEVAEVVAEVPASLYVLENVQNMTVEQTGERTVPFIKMLRSKRPDTPILMAESPNMWSQGEKHELWRKAYDQLKAEGMKDLYYLPGDKMYSSSEDGTVDRVHPTDLGFYTMAVAYEPVLRELMGDFGTTTTATAAK